MLHLNIKKEIYKVCTEIWINADAEAEFLESLDT